MAIKDAILSHMDAETGGSIKVHNKDGWYVAQLTMSYQYKGMEFSQTTPNISIGIAHSLNIPAGATDIHATVQEWWGFGWSTIFTKDYGSPVTECFDLYGTTLNPSYEKVAC